MSPLAKLRMLAAMFAGVVTEKPKPQRDVRKKAYRISEDGIRRVAVRIGEFFGASTVGKFESRKDRKARRLAILAAASNPAVPEADRTELQKEAARVRVKPPREHKGYGPALVANARKRAKTRRRKAAVWGKGV